MFDFTAIKLNLDNVNGGLPNVKVTAMREWFEYKDGARTNKQLGYNYTIVFINGSCEKASLKVQGRATITQEILDASANGIEAVIEGFIGKPYRTGNGGLDLSATATSITAI